MQDRVPLYPGRVKLTPVSGQENVYDMVRADQPTQEGTPLNKNSLLKDATAAMFQLGTDAVPDDALNALGKLWNNLGELNMWSKAKYSYSQKTLSGQYYETGSYGIEYTFYDSLEVDAQGPHLSGKHKESFRKLSAARTALVGKYVYLSIYPTKYPNPPDPVYASSFKIVNKVSSYSDSKFRVDGDVISFESSKVSSEYLNSFDPGAYPSGASDGYVYSGPYKLGDFVTAEFSQYRGTGLVGQSYKNSITSAKKINIMLITTEGYIGIAVRPLNQLLVLGFSDDATPKSYISTLSWGEGTVSWYGESLVSQMNEIGTLYNVLLI